MPATSADNPITTETRTIAGVRTFLRRVEGGGTPTVFVHGNPTHSEDWLPFMHAGPGPSVALDLPGFGRSERVGLERFAGDMDAYAKFLGAALDELEIGEHNLVVHDWGGIGLLTAQRRADAVRRLVVIDAVPLTAGYRWHWIARIWRRRGLGELFNRGTTRAGLALLLRQARPGYAPMPEEFIEMIWEHWDAGTAAAVLRLYRSADPAAMTAAGAQLERLRCPALVAWGESDPYIPAAFGRWYAASLPNAELLELDRAGHWPWIDRPELIGQVARFLDG